MMRTTLNLPDDAYDVARSFANSRGISIGEAVGELIRRGLNPGPVIDTSGDIPHFVVPPNAAPITLEKTLEAEDEV